jgi:hypothetical protein
MHDLIAIAKRLEALALDGKTARLTPTTALHCARARIAPTLAELR